MTFLPVLPVWVLLVFTAVIVTVRVVNLYRLLVRTAPGRYRDIVLRWTGLTSAALLLVLAAFRPVTGGDADQPPPVAEPVSNINLFLVVDRSVTSRVADYGDGEPRMAGIRDDISALLDEFPGARVGLIGFATEANVNWPLSQDEWSFKAYLKNLSAYSLTPPDAANFIDPTIARDVLREQLEAAKENYPQAENLIFYFGDGATGSLAQPKRFDVPADLYSGGAVFGYGTTEGGPIPHSYSNGRLNYIADPATGAALRIEYNEARLADIAGSLNVAYFHRQAGKFEMPTLDVETSLISDVPEPKADDTLGRTELYWIFALFSAALLLVEVILTVREYRRNRMSRSDFTAEDVLR